MTSAALLPSPERREQIFSNPRSSTSNRLQIYYVQFLSCTSRGDLFDRSSRYRPRATTRSHASCVIIPGSEGASHTRLWTLHLGVPSEALLNAKNSLTAVPALTAVLALTSAEKAASLGAVALQRARAQTPTTGAAATAEAAEARRPTAEEGTAPEAAWAEPSRTAVASRSRGGEAVKTAAQAVALPVGTALCATWTSELD